MFSYVLLYFTCKWKSPLCWKGKGWKRACPFYSCKNLWATSCPPLYRWCDKSHRLIRSTSFFSQTSPSFPPVKINKERRKRNKKGALRDWMSQRLVMNYRHSSLGQRFTPSPCQEGRRVAGSLDPEEAALWFPVPTAGSSWHGHQQRQRNPMEGNWKTRNTRQLWRETTLVIPTRAAASALSVRRFLAPSDAQHVQMPKCPVPKDRSFTAQSDFGMFLAWYLKQRYEVLASLLHAATLRTKSLQFSWEQGTSGAVSCTLFSFPQYFTCLPSLLWKKCYIHIKVDSCPTLCPALVTITKQRIDCFHRQTLGGGFPPAPEVGSLLMKSKTGQRSPFFIHCGFKWTIQLTCMKSAWPSGLPSALQVGIDVTS